MHERIIRTTYFCLLQTMMLIFSALLKHLMANEDETMMTDLLQKNAIPFDDQGKQVCVYLNHI